MSEDVVKLSYLVNSTDFTMAGEASSGVKKVLKQLGVDPEIVRKVSIAMYEGEINMVIHAHGGTINVEIYPDKILMILEDKGPGIPDIDKAMTPGWSTASEEVRELGFGAGMGLYNIKKYTDKLDIKTQIGVGTTLTMQVNV